MASKDYIEGPAYQASDTSPFSDPAGIGSMWNKLTGSGLTNAQMQEMSANSAEASKNRAFQEYMFNRETDLANTAYQRSVSDMIAAGVNPALMMSRGSSGASTPSAPSGDSASFSGAGSNGDPAAVIQMLMMSKQLQALTAQAAASNAAAKKSLADAGLSEAKAKETAANTANVEIDTKFKHETFSARKRGIELANDLSGAQARHIYKQIDYAEEQIKLALKQTASEEERASLLRSQAILNRASAAEIVSLLPLKSKLLEAQTASQTAAAQYSFVQAAYQQGLIDEGMISAAVRQATAGARSQESAAKLNEYIDALRRGKALDGSFSGIPFVDRFFNDLSNGLLGALSNISLAGLGSMSGFIK